MPSIDPGNFLRLEFSCCFLQSYNGHIFAIDINATQTPQKKLPTWSHSEEFMSARHASMLHVMCSLR
jgi:hypothetical protein